MSKSPVTDYYSFHGINFKVSSELPGVSERLRSRLRRHMISDEPRADFSFEYLCAPDSSSHMVGEPIGPLRPVYDPPKGRIVYSDIENKLYIDLEGQIRALCDIDDGTVRVSAAPSEAENCWLLSHPIFTLPFVELLKRRELYSIHAGTLRKGNKGLLLPGDSGSGKSTLTIALLRAGFDFLGDDTAFLTKHADEVIALSFPDEIDVTDETAGFFPELRHFLDIPRSSGGSKSSFRVEEFYDADIASQCRPTAIVFPNIADTATSAIREISADEALIRLAPNVLLTDPEASQAHFDILSDLVRQAACYSMETGRDFDEIPVLLSSILE